MAYDSVSGGRTWAQRLAEADRLMQTFRVLRPRTLAAVAYLTLAIAGAAFMFWFPTTGLKTLLGDFGFYVWNWFMLGGASIGLIGSVSKRYQIEFIAFPFLITALTVFGIQLVARIDDADSPGATLGIAMIFFFAATELVGRAWEVFKVIRISLDFQRRIADE